MIIGQIGWLQPEDKAEWEAVQEWLQDRGPDGCPIKASGITSNMDTIAEIVVLWRKRQAPKPCTPYFSVNAGSDDKSRADCLSHGPFIG